MRGKTALIARLFCTFALVLAMLPVRATAMVCAMPVAVPVPKASCDMPCCSPHERGHMTCSAGATDHGECDGAKVKARKPNGNELTSSRSSCKCEMQSGNSIPATAEKVVATSFDHFTVAAFVERPVVIPALPHFSEPGILGFDSGPPHRRAFVPDLGRAPPVA